MSQRRMLLGTDGNKEQVMGLRLFFHTLKKNSSSTFEDWEIVVVHPSYSTLDRSCFADIAPSVTVFPIYQEKRADKYYVKLLLKGFVENTGSADDLTLYLDYDHIARSEIRLPCLDAGDLYVGSEVKPLSAVVDQTVFSDLDQRILLNTHYNASLIYGTNLTLKMAVRDWANLYEECVGRVATRYVEEIAFFLSACKSGCRVIPITPKIQSGWQQRAQDCTLFHYGGEHYLATAIKQLLTELSKETKDGSSIDQLTFASELVNEMGELKGLQDLRV